MPHHAQLPSARSCCRWLRDGDGKRVYSARMPLPNDPPQSPLLQPEPPLRPALPRIPFVECRNWQRGALRHKVDLIVLHCMEGDEALYRAERCAAWMAGENAPKSSAHYFVDGDSIVQGVHDECIAWHAPGANNNGIGIEHAGKAKQTREEWLDTNGVPMFDLSAQLTASLCLKWQIPVVYVNAEDLLAKPQLRGITTHNEVTKAFKRSTHTDPGKGFPIDWYLARVLKYVVQPPAGIV